MSDPGYAPRLAGDWHDDDGTVIDSLIELSQTPADETAADVVTPSHAGYEPPRKPNRLVTGYLTVSQSLVPVMLLPADTDRTSLTVLVTGGAASDAVYLADDPSDLAYFGGSGSSVRVAAGVSIGMSGYYGPLYMVPGTVAGTINVSWWAVTK